MPLWHTEGALPADDQTETQQPADLNANLNQIWQAQQDRRRDALAPRWNARTRTIANRGDLCAIWEMWNYINDRLHLA